MSVGQLVALVLCVVLWLTIPVGAAFLLLFSDLGGNEHESRALAADTSKQTK